MNPFSLAFRPVAARRTSGIPQLKAVSMLTVGLIAILTLGLLNTDAHAQNATKQTLTNFQAGNNDGARVFAGLINVNGTFYGTTTQGGGYGFVGYGFGTIYTFNPATNTEKVIYHFQGDTSDGAIPYGSPVYVDGTLYGTTEQCGSAGKGTIWSFNLATNTEKILHNFQDTASGNFDGSSPFGGLTYDSATEKLYGTTRQGGDLGNGNGTIFCINPDGTGYQTLLSLSTDVFDIQDRMILVNGVFYGTSNQGGPNNDGTVFSFDPSTNTLTTLYNFNNSDGINPNAGLINDGATLYGTTAAGGNSGNGTIFSISTNGTSFQRLYTFQGGTTDGSGSRSSLLENNGILYGTTTEGGSANDGIVFSLDTTTHVETVLYQFLSQGNSDGINPQGNLLFYNGALYGVTELGGTYSDYYYPTGAGTIYSLTLSTVTAPTAHNDAGRVLRNTTLNIPAPGVLTNDYNGGSSPITAALVTTTTHGTLTFHSDGSFQYVPTTGFLGTDSFTYQDKNAIGTSNIATCTITVQPTAPIAVNNSNNVKYETTFTVPAPGVLGNDDNGGSGPMTAVLVNPVSHGTVTLSSNGAFTYTPAAGFSGTDSFTYQAVNSVGKSNIATASLIVQPGIPTARDDHGHGYYNTTLNISAPGVLGNDDTGGKTITAKLVSNVSHGTLTLNGDGSFVYTPTKGFVGTDSFSYQDTNSVGTGNTATCTITVSPVAPIAVNNSNNVKKDTTFTVPAPGVLGNDDNGGSSPITASLVTTTSHGTLTLNSNGSFTYTPNAGFTGTDSFTYQAVNSVGKSNVATATLIVQ